MLRTTRTPTTGVDEHRLKAVSSTRSMRSLETDRRPVDQLVSGQWSVSDDRHSLQVYPGSARRSGQPTRRVLCSSATNLWSLGELNPPADVIL